MNKYLMLLSILLISSTIYAQEIDLIKSDIFKDSKRRSRLSFAVEDGAGGLITIRSFHAGVRAKRKGYYIQYFDENLKLLKELEYKVDDSYIKSVLRKGDQVHLIEYVTDKRADRVIFNDIAIDLKTFRLRKKEFLSFSKDDQNKVFGVPVFPFLFNNYAKYDRNYFGQIDISDNGKYFVVNFDLKSDELETHKVFVSMINLKKSTSN